jgi:AcrR family transcriptional regulator
VTPSRPLRADAQRNRDRLLAVAADAFAADGLAVPLDDIARRAGVGPGTLYRHFPTKEALFEAVVADRLERLAREARDLTGAADPGAAFFGFVDRLAGAAAAKRDLADALDEAGVALGPALAGTAADLRAGIAALLDRAQRAGAVRADLHPEDLMALLSGLTLAMRPRAGADPGRALAVLRDGLRATAPPTPPNVTPAVQATAQSGAGVPVAGPRG